MERLQQLIEDAVSALTALDAYALEKIRSEIQGLPSRSALCGGNSARLRLRIVCWAHCCRKRRATYGCFGPARSADSRILRRAVTHFRPL